MMNWIWLGAMIVFGILEAATAGLVSIWFVCGSVAALLATFLGAALWLQVVLFLSVSAITLAATRPLVRKMSAKAVPTNLDRAIGSAARRMLGRVKLDGQMNSETMLNQTITSSAMA